MLYYAQLDADNICFTISKVPQKMYADNIVLLKEYDISVLGKRYQNGIWEEVSEEPQPPSDTEIIMQALTDSEIRELEQQQGQEMLAQQLTDIEISLLERGVL